MKKPLAVMAMVLMAAVLAFPPAALAICALNLSSGATSVFIVDPGAGDADPTVGSVVSIGAVGNWLVNVTTGLSTPVLGNAGRAALDCNSVDVFSGAGGTLTIKLTDTGFSLSPVVPFAQATMGIGGTTAGTISYLTYIDTANQPSGTTGLIGTLGPFGGLSFGGDTANNNVITSSQFSLTQVMRITHTGFGTTSFNASLDIVPLPSTLLLLGAGLLGLVGLRVRRKIKG